MRIKDIDGLSKETFSDCGLAEIYASVCNPTLTMSPFLDDADMTADALEQGDRLVASHPSSFSVQKGFDPLCVVQLHSLVREHGHCIAVHSPFRKLAPMGDNHSDGSSSVKYKWVSVATNLCLS